MSVRLFVLGVLYDKSSHGYEIKETARLWGLERWAGIQEGSIYHALTKLESEGAIQEQNSELSENNRPRHIFSITQQGRETFLSLLRETTRSASVEKRDIDIALAFLDFLPPEERLALLNERQTILHQALAELLERQHNTRRLYPNLHQWVEIGVRHSQGRLEFELEWNRELLATVGDWRQRHSENS